ncbi:peptidase M23-like protein [Kribbella rubisoli]|uniref:Peptidase M23-like protein n=2 Tax=Kribbella rubisoli TaxID=3075929 RepID=A0A4Q7W4L2_9ACTN|nr:peptidase M23-like protein [Kribbella rubisoli]
MYVTGGGQREPALGYPQSRDRGSGAVPDDGIFPGMNLALLSLAILPGATSDWPLQPRPEVVHGFELPAKPWLSGHRGVDLAGRPGQPVLAATPGTITYAGPLAGRGVITITTGARRTTYEPVVPAVSVGTTVQTGAVIGRLSAAGSHCLPRACLHWGLLQGKQYLNPLTLIPNRPVRLLPLTDQQAQSARAPSPVLPTPRASDTSPAPPDSNQRTAKLIIAATAALTLTAGLLIRRE